MYASGAVPGKIVTIGSESLRYDLIAFVAPQGGGKDTQVGMLNRVTCPKTQILTMSSIFGHYQVTDPAFAQEQAMRMSRGELVGDDVTVSCLRRYIGEMCVGASTLVLNGFPRSGAQAFALEGTGYQFCGIRRPRIGAIVMDLTEELAYQRCLGRAHDAQRANKPVRGDDRPDLIQKRLATYFKHLPEIVGALKVVGDVFEIDASRSMDEVHDLVVGAVTGKSEEFKV